VANLRLEGVKRGWTSEGLEAKTKALRDDFKPRAARFIEEHMHRYDKVLSQSTQASAKKGH
jgi:hypothetical protein